MKLKKLIIHNIASIEDATIDFTATPLSDSELFLITGKTGAGKSTILDAICLALYANTPRLNNLKMEGDVEGTETKIRDTICLVRKGTKEAYSRLTFTGSDGIEYEAEWSAVCPRSVWKKSWILTNLSNTNIPPLTLEGRGSKFANNNAIEQLICEHAVGLGLEQFCRTTMLAQGEFTRFLNSADNEKSEILEKITGTEIYSRIGMKIFEMANAKKRDYEEAERKKNNIELFSDEQIEEKNTEIQNLANQQLELSNKQATQEKKRQWLTTEVDLLKKIDAAQETYNQAKQITESEDFLTRKNTIRQWNETSESRGYIQNIEQAKKDVEAQDNALKRADTSYKLILQGKAYFANQIERSERELAEKNIDGLKAQIENINAKNSELILEAEVLQKKMEQSGVDKLREQKTQCIAQIIQIPLVEGAVKGLQRAQEYHVVQKKELKDKQDAIDQSKVTLKELQTKLEIAKRDKELAQLDFDCQKDTVHEFAQAMRAKLKIGDSCPVCGQKVKTDLMPEEELKSLYKNHEDKLSNANKVFNDYESQVNKLTLEISSNELLLHADRQRYDENRAVKEAQENLQARWKLCQLGDFNPNLSLEQMLNIIDQYERRLREEEETLSAKIYEINEDNSMHKAILETINYNQKQINKLNRDISEAEQLKQTIENAQGELKQIAQTIASLSGYFPQYKDLQAISPIKVENLLTQTNNLSNQVASINALKKAAQERERENRSLLDKFLLEHEDYSEQTLLTLNTYTQAKISDLSTQVAEQERAVIQKHTTLTDLQKSLQQHLECKPQYEQDETTETLTKSIEGIDTQINELSKQRGRIEQLLKTDTDNRNKLAAVRKEIELKKKEHVRWDRLNDLLGDKNGTTFRKIAQGYILSNLISTANIYMSKLTDRYRLRSQPGSFVINVIDAYQGHEVRPSSTISGGESFLVSLALALALSDIGQNLQVGTLFIDEGFGTLSGEPLQNAIYTLQSLHKQTGRQVGIISHVDELKERIPVQIQVTQQPNKSSSTISIVG